MSVASKNLFELLGNDPDSDGEPRAPTKTVVKQTVTSKKKDAPVDVPAPARGNNRGGRKYGGNEGAFRDGETGAESNRRRPTDVEGERTHKTTSGGRGGRGAGRGDRRGGDRKAFDRHSQTGRVDTTKATAQGWGANTGDGEAADEAAGEAIAKADAVDPAVAEAEKAEAEAREAEEKQKTYDEYLAEIAEKKAALGAPTSVRKPNEGARDNKKWENATVLAAKEEEAFVAPKEVKAKAPKEKKVKNVLEIDQAYQEPKTERRGGDRGGRGGRGGDRGGRGRGDRGGDRGAFRGDRGDRRPAAPKAAAAPVNIADSSAFPALGK